jgi:hypothetical protein
MPSRWEGAVAVDDVVALNADAVRLLALPYAIWNNHATAPMSVWLARDAAHVRKAPAAK